MFIIKNAFKNISRSLGRNILIGIIALVIAISSCIALSIKQSAKTAIDQGLQDITITANITQNFEKIREQMKDQNPGSRAPISFSELTLDEMLVYAGDSNVSDFTYSLSTSVSKTDGFEPYSQTETEISENNNADSPNNRQPNMGGRGDKGGMVGMGTQGDFTLTGYSSESAMNSFISGASKISQGEIFSFDSADYSCVISDTLATLNDLSVGDSILISNPNDETETYTLTIKGLFSASNDSFSGGMPMPNFSTSTNAQNQIYVNYFTAKDITDNSSSVAVTSTNDYGQETTTALRSQTNGTYYFSDKDSYNLFKENVYTMGLSENYTVTSADEAMFEQSIQPLKNLENFANVFLVLVLIIGGIILIVLNIFNVRERKYEVGVLTAIGMKKSKVMAQFICELFIVTFVAILIGAGVGACASVPTANALLSSQITTSSNSQDNIDRNFGRPGEKDMIEDNRMPQNDMNNMFVAPGLNGPKVNYIDSIAATTDLTVIGQLILLGIALTIISSCGAVIFIMRYEPLKILSNRN